MINPLGVSQSEPSQLKNGNLLQSKFSGPTTALHKESEPAAINNILTFNREGKNGDKTATHIGSGGNNGGGLVKQRLRMKDQTKLNKDHASSKKGINEQGAQSSLSMSNFNSFMHKEGAVSGKSPPTWEPSSIHSLISQKSSSGHPGFLSSINSGLDGQSPVEFQRSEFEALESIYMGLSDFLVIQRPSEEISQSYLPAHYMVKIKPQNTRTEENFCWVVLEVKYSETYPRIFPTIFSLGRSDSSFPDRDSPDEANGKPISEPNLSELNIEVRSYASTLLQDKRLQMYDVILRIQESLEVINKDTSQYARYRESQRQNQLQKHLFKQLSGHYEEESKGHKQSESNSEDLRGQSSSGDQIHNSSSVKQESSESENYQLNKRGGSSDMTQLRLMKEHSELLREEAKMNQDGLQMWREMAQIQQQQKNSAQDEYALYGIEAANQFDQDFLFDDQAIQQPILSGPSRYKQDFEELEKIGEGGGGRVYRARNKIDKSEYAIKKVRLYHRNPEVNERIKRECNVLSRLHNIHIVRYFNTWLETVEDKREIEALGFSSDEEDQQSSSDEEFNLHTDSYQLQSSPLRRSAKSEVEETYSDQSDDYYVEDDEQGSYVSSGSDEEESNLYSRQQKNNKPATKKEKLKYEEPSSYHSDSDLYSGDLYSRQENHKGLKRGGGGRGKKAKLDKKQFDKQKHHKLNKLKAKNQCSGNAQLSGGHAAFTKKANGKSGVNKREQDESEGELASEMKDQVKSIRKQKKAPQWKPFIKPKKQQQGIQVLYIAMEYCEGRNLRNFISDSSTMSKNDLIDLKWKIFAQVVDALHYLHGMGLIHRDLKPQNIFLDKTNNVKLGDFGLATPHHHHTHQEDKSSLAPTLNGNSKGRNIKPQNGNPKKFMHSVGIGTPLYMAPEQRRGNAGDYTFLADMYSLGLICFEMFVGGFKTIIEMDKAFSHLRQTNEIDPEYTAGSKIPENAQTLIKWLCKEDPNERPSTTALFQSELMPQKLEDNVFKKFVISISNHKTAESLKLMNFLMKRKTPKLVDITYEGFMNPRGGSLLSLTGQVSQQASSGFENFLKSKEQIIKSVLKQELKQIFILHGAIDLDLPVVTPAQDSATVFMSLRQQALPMERKQSTHSEGVKKSQPLIEEDYTAAYFADVECYNPAKKEMSKPFVKGPNFHHQNAATLRYLKENDIQRVTLHNFEPPQHPAFRVLDDTGILLQLQMNLQMSLARYAARQQIPFMKRYHVGKVYRKNHLPRCGGNLLDSLEASFDILSHSASPGDTLLHEAEVLKVCDQVAQAYLKELGGRYRLRVSSTEVIDGIFDEGGVEMRHRHACMKLLSGLENKQWKEVRKQMVSEGLVTGEAAERMGEIMRVRGGVVQVEEQVRKLRYLKKPDRFRLVIERMKSIRNYLKYFGVQEEEETSGTIIFDFGLVLENQLSYYSGLIFKLTAPSTQSELESLYQQQLQSQSKFQKAFATTTGQNPMTFSSPQGSSNYGAQTDRKLSGNKNNQVSSFVLNATPLNQAQSTNQQSTVTNNFQTRRGGRKGRLISNEFNGLVNFKKTQDSGEQSIQANFRNQPVPPLSSQALKARLINSSPQETIAVGGRYDNLVAHFQPMEIPVAVGVRFFCQRLIQKILYQELKKKNATQTSLYSQVDVFVVSRGDMTMEKMQLLSELWKNNIRAEADFSNDFEPHDPSQQQRARFLITFKKTVFTNTKKVKVKDFECRIESDEHRDSVVQYIKSRIKSYTV